MITKLKFDYLSTDLLDKAYYHVFGHMDRPGTQPI